MERTLPTEIEAVRTRLADIAEERKSLPDDAFAARTDLLDEEHELEARLAALKDEVVDEERGAAERHVAEHTDLAEIPRLPDADDRA